MTQIFVEQPPHPSDVNRGTPAAPKPRQNLARVWQTVGLIGLLVALLGGGVWWLWPHEFHGVLLQSPDLAPDFSLTASTGKPVQLSDFRGKVVLLFFGYTACTDVCPLRLAELMQTMSLLGKDAEKVQVIFVTIDPLHDTVARLNRYVNAFDPAFLGVTGPTATINAVATQFGVFYDQAAMTAGSAIGHTSTVTVIDRAGHVRLLLPAGLSTADIAEDLRYLIRR
ncbi:SCO family protein [soil metagenome]